MILPLTCRAIASAILNQELEWPAAVRAELSRGTMDDDAEEAPKSIPLPCIIVNAPSAQRIDPQVATSYVDVLVQVQHSVDDTHTDTHQAHAQEVYEFLTGDDFLAACNQYASFTAFGVDGVDCQFDRVGRRWQSAFSFRILAAPSTIA